MSQRPDNRPGQAPGVPAAPFRLTLKAGFPVETPSHWSDTIKRISPSPSEGSAESPQSTSAHWPKKKHHLKLITFNLNSVCHFLSSFFPSPPLSDIHTHPLIHINTRTHTLLIPRMHFKSSLRLPHQFRNRLAN